MATYRQAALIILVGFGVMIVVDGLMLVGETETPDVVYPTRLYPVIIFGAIMIVGGILAYGKSATGSYSPAAWIRNFALMKWKDIPDLDKEIWSTLKDWKPLRLRESYSNLDDDVYLASCTLKDGRFFPCVEFVEVGTADQERIFPRYGLLRRYYRFDAEWMIAAASVVSVERSPYAITNDKVLKKLIVHGHWDDPIMHAKLVLRDGKECWTHVGYQYFLPVPQGYKAIDVVDVTYPPEDYDWVSIDGQVDRRLRRMICLFKRAEG